MAESSVATRTVSTEGARTVTALMGITVLFALLGSEIKTAGNAKQGAGVKTVDGITAGGRIILGGMLGTSVLILLTHAGEAGRQFAVGLALVTMATATLVYGAPVWDAINGALGSTPTTGTGSTSPTTATTSTAASAATIATNLAG